MDNYLQLYQVLKDSLRIDFLLSLYRMILKSKCCPGTSQDDWLKNLCYLHTKGWLYYGKEEGQIKVVVGAYRIKEFNEDIIKTYPANEEGNIFYVAFTVSLAKDKLLLRRMLHDYLKQNPDVVEVIICKDDISKDFLRIKIKGEENGQEQVPELTNTTVVPS